MASIHKTFQVGVVLASADVNDGLNPTTADHMPYAVASGTVSWSISSANSADAYVTFPSGRFTKTPTVMITPQSAGGGIQRIQFHAFPVTPTGVTIRGITYDASNTTIATQTIGWVAIQMDA